MVLESFKRMWLGWNRVVKGIFWAQNAVLMGIAYFVGVGPVALGFRLLGRTLLDRAPADPQAASYWSARKGRPISMDEAARRY